MIAKYYNYSNTLVVRNPVYKISNSLMGEPINEVIHKYMQSVFFRNALLLASISFYQQVKNYLSDSNTLTDKQKEKIQLSFLKYLTRMSTRCTPFGFFSTVSSQLVDNLVFAKSEAMDLDLVLKLDMSLLESIANVISYNYCDYLEYSLNSTLINNEDEYSYIKYYYLELKRIHEVVTIEGNEYIDLLFSNQHRLLKITEIIELLQTINQEISEDEIKDFIYELIDSKLLVNQLSVQVTGIDYQDRLIFVIHNLIKYTADHSLLNNILEIFSLVQSQTTESDFEITRNYIIKLLFEFNIPFNENHIFHCNLYREIGAVQNIDGRVISDVIKGLDILSLFSLKRENEDLTDFKSAFTDTYGAAIMPLSQVLDSATGLGYPVNKIKLDESNSLLQELTLKSGGKPEWSKHKYHNKNHKFWFNKYIACISSGASEIELQDSDFINFENQAHQMPVTFSCSFSIIENKNEVIKDKSYLVKYNGWGGSSALNYLARFTGDNREISNLCREMADVEEKQLTKNEILAEICHMPDSKIGNIVSHIGFRNYEIPYLVNSSVSSEFTININDIHLGVFDNKFVLVSKKHNKVIKPILSNAHNYKTSEHPVYRFLCELQNDNHISGPYLDFGWWTNEVSFFPQIRYKNLIFVPRSWTLNQDFFSDYLSGKETLEEARIRFLLIPGMVKVFVAGEGDNELYINSDILIHWRMFLDYLSKQKNMKVIIKEYNYSNDDSYNNEVILSLFKKQTL